MQTKEYLKKYGRKLDLRLYECLFEKANQTLVLEELAKFQNADGGFGNALEPDVRAPGSSALATTVAFQYLSKINAKPNELTYKAIRYLVDSYEQDKRR